MKLKQAKENDIQHDIQQAKENDIQQPLNLANPQVNNTIIISVEIQFVLNITPKLGFYSMVYSMVGATLYFHELFFFDFCLRFLFGRFGNIMLSPWRYWGCESLSLFSFNIITSNFGAISGIIAGECRNWKNENE